MSLRQLESGIEVKVEDQGIGILPEEISRVTEPFFRGTNIGVISGLGIGLTIARAAIESHGGSISLQSVPDHGTTVIIEVPL